MRRLLLIAVCFIATFAGLLLLDGSKRFSTAKAALLALGSNTVVVYRGKVEIYVEIYKLPPYFNERALLDELSQKKGDFSEIRNVCTSNGLKTTWEGSFTERLALNLESGRYVIIGLNLSDALALFAIEELEKRAVWDLNNK